VVLTLSGRIEAADVAELQRLLGLEAVPDRVVLDLRDVTIVDRKAVNFLANCETINIKLENCPAYIREWIARESDSGSQRKRFNAPERSARDKTTN
jgi:hypothetical protein